MRSVRSLGYAFVSGGYDFHLGHLTIGPVASLQYTDVHVDGFNENGSSAPLAIHSGTEESLRSDIGFRVFYGWRIGHILIQPSLKAAWEHEYKYSALPIAAGFADVPGPSATFFGPQRRSRQCGRQRRIFCAVFEHDFDLCLL